MKPSEVLQIIAQELQVKADLGEINQLLKQKKGLAIKFRMTGEKLGYLGHTAPIKSLTAEGVKIISVNKVKLIPYADMATFQKAKPKVERKVFPKILQEKSPTKGKAATAAPAPVFSKKSKSRFDDDDEDEDDFDDDDLVEIKPASKRRRPLSGGSSFIPAKGRTGRKVR